VRRPRPRASGELVKDQLVDLVGRRAGAEDLFPPTPVGSLHFESRWRPHVVADSLAGLLEQLAQSF
jgi:hypothetical protein